MNEEKLGHLAAIGSLAATYLHYLPDVAAGFAIAWYIYLFYHAWKTKQSS